MMSDGDRGVVLDTDKLVKALERFIETALQLTESERRAAGPKYVGDHRLDPLAAAAGNAKELLPFARQLVEERDEANEWAEYERTQNAQLREENERLKDELGVNAIHRYCFSPKKAEDLQSRFATAEESSQENAALATKLDEEVKDLLARVHVAEQWRSDNSARYAAAITNAETLHADNNMLRKELTYWKGKALDLRSEREYQLDARLNRAEVVVEESKVLRRFIGESRYARNFVVPSGVFVRYDEAIRQYEEGR